MGQDYILIQNLRQLLLRQPGLFPNQLYILADRQIERLFFSHSSTPSMPAGVMFGAESADMCASCGDDSNHCPRLIGNGDFIETGAPSVL